MTVRQLIQDLTYYPMGAEITVSCNYSAEQIPMTKCKGAIFDIKDIDTFGEQVQIIFDDWKYKAERSE